MEGCRECRESEVWVEEKRWKLSGWKKFGGMATTIRGIRLYSFTTYYTAQIKRVAIQLDLQTTHDYNYNRNSNPSHCPVLLNTPVQIHPTEPEIEHN